MEYAAGVAIVKTIGIDVTIQCVKAVSCTAQGIYGLLRNIGSIDTGGAVSKYMREADIECQVQLLESVVSAIDVNRHHTEPLSLCIKDLRSCLDQIEKILREFQTRIDFNRSIWLFSSLRSYGFSDLHDELKLHTRHLADRSSRLFDIIKINGYLNAMEPEEPELIKLI